MGTKIGDVPKDMAEELEENYSERKFPYIVREEEGEFAIMVHSKPFGGTKLTEEEKEEREEVAKKKKEASRKKRLASAKEKLEAAQEKVDALEED